MGCTRPSYLRCTGTMPGTTTAALPLLACTGACECCRALFWPTWADMHTQCSYDSAKRGCLPQRVTQRRHTEYRHFCYCCCPAVLLFNSSMLCLFSLPCRAPLQLVLTNTDCRLMLCICIAGDCSSVHKACTTCQFRRISGTRSSTALMCSMCAPGWRLRRDKGLKTCGKST